MIENTRSEYLVIRQAFGPDARLVETAGAPGRPGRVTIHLDGGVIGYGRTFRAALADALSFTTPGIIRACDLPTTF